MTNTAAVPALSPPSARGRLAGGALILVAAAGYGLMPWFFTHATRAGLAAPTTMAGRFIIAALGVWLIIGIRRPVLPHWTVNLRIGTFGAFCWTLQSIGYMLAVTHLGASLATLLIYTYPLIVVVFAILTGRQRPHLFLLGAAALVATGLLAVFSAGLGGSGLAVAGLAAGLASAATYAGFILASEPLSRGLDPFLFTALALTGAALATTAVTLVRGGIQAEALLRGSTAIAGLAVVSTIVAATTFLLGLRMVGAATASVLSCTEVVVSCTVAAVALGERLTPIQLAGCACILAAAIMLTARRRSPEDAKGGATHMSAKPVVPAPFRVSGKR